MAVKKKKVGNLWVRVVIDGKTNIGKRQTVSSKSRADWKKEKNEIKH